jgi:hypothetical protein
MQGTELVHSAATNSKMPQKETKRKKKKKGKQQSNYSMT